MAQIRNSARVTAPVFHHSCFITLCMKVFAACANLLRCISSRSRGTFGVRARRGESLFGEQALGRKAMRRRLALPKHFPHTGGQAVRNAMNTFCPISVISVIRGQVFGCGGAALGFLRHSSFELRHSCINYCEATARDTVSSFSRTMLWVSNSGNTIGSPDFPG